VNESKQKQLFEAVRGNPGVEAPSDFAMQVIGAIRREETREREASLFEQLSVLFPRLATAALLVIAAGVVFEILFNDDLFSRLSQASDQWLLPMGWL
jgi:hypothetical protein